VIRPDRDVVISTSSLDTADSDYPGRQPQKQPFTIWHSRQSARPLPSMVKAGSGWFLVEPPKKHKPDRFQSVMATLRVRTNPCCYSCRNRSRQQFSV